MRKVYLEVKTKLILNLEEGVDISDVIDEMEYGFEPQPEHGELLDSEILEYDVKDSK
jgi:hypothetical protein